MSIQDRVELLYKVLVLKTMHFLHWFGQINGHYVHDNLGFIFSLNVNIGLILYINIKEP